MNMTFARRYITLLGIVLALGLLCAVPDVGAQAPRKGYQLLRTFQDRFTFEYPTKDWEAITGGTSSLFALTQKKREASVVLEYQPLRLELAPNEIDEEFAKLEVEPVTTRQPGAAGLAIKLIDVAGRKVIVVDYDRRGIFGPEHVRQYSMPVGKHLYRLVCSAPPDKFAKYEPVFTTMVDTFRVAGTTTSAAPTAAAKN